jgi:hypothetical protein
MHALGGGMSADARLAHAMNETATSAAKYRTMPIVRTYRREFLMSTNGATAAASIVGQLKQFGDPRADSGAARARRL